MVLSPSINGVTWVALVSLRNHPQYPGYHHQGAKGSPQGTTKGVVPRIIGVVPRVLGVVPKVLGVVPRILGVVRRILGVVPRGHSAGAQGAAGIPCESKKYCTCFPSALVMFLGSSPSREMNSPTWTGLRGLSSPGLKRYTPVSISQMMHARLHTSMGVLTGENPSTTSGERYSSVWRAGRVRSPGY